MNRPATIPETFVAQSKIRAIIRAEIQRYTDAILAPAIGEAIGVEVREVEARFAARLDEVMKELMTQK
jgi:hypothetical protein